MRKPLQVFSWLVIASAFILMAVISYWLFYPYKVIDIYGDAFKVTEPKVKQGDSVGFITNNCKYMNVTAETSRAFVNEIIYYVPSVTTAMKIGCNTTVIYVPIPPELPPGKYFLQNIYEYNVNPLRTITIIHNTEKFEVIKGD